MRFIFGDTETSGLGEDARVVEIAWCETDNNLNVVSSFHSLIDPGVLISPSASGIHGITNEMVAQEPTIDEFFEMHNYPLAMGDVILVAHNAPFDRRFFEPHVGSLVGTMCTLKLARVLFPDAENHKLQTLRYMFGLDAGDAHSADGDVRVLVDLVKYMSSTHNLSLDELYRLSNQPILIEKMTFGKHKGTALKDLPKSYVSWLMGLENLDDNLRYSLNLL